MEDPHVVVPRLRVEGLVVPISSLTSRSLYPNPAFPASLPRARIRIRIWKDCQNHGCFLGILNTGAVLQVVQGIPKRDHHSCSLSHDLSYVLPAEESTSGGTSARSSTGCAGFGEP